MNQLFDHKNKCKIKTLFYATDCFFYFKIKFYKKF